jgi:hypothetical protein
MSVEAISGISARAIEVSLATRATSIELARFTWTGKMRS